MKISFNIRDSPVIRKAAAYVVMGINEEGYKEVLSITIDENESAKLCYPCSGILESLFSSQMSFLQKILKDITSDSQKSEVSQ